MTPVNQQMATKISGETSACISVVLAAFSSETLVLIYLTTSSHPRRA
jgi:hypothetical protein